MEPIHVPGPPKEAFNKNRRVSDLIRAQVNHLKHIEVQASRRICASGFRIIRSSPKTTPRATSLR